MFVSFLLQLPDVAKRTTQNNAPSGVLRYTNYPFIGMKASSGSAHAFFFGVKKSTIPFAFPLRGSARDNSILQDQGCCRESARKTPAEAPIVTIDGARDVGTDCALCNASTERARHAPAFF
jgi:hypothetical protein